MGKNGKETSRIRRWRESEGLTQEKAAEVIGINRCTLARIEHWKMPVGKNLARKIAPFTKQKPGEVMDEYERKLAAQRKAASR